MGSRSEFGGRGTSVLVLSGVIAGMITAACNVYERGLLGQAATAGASGAGMAGSSGAREVDAGNGDDPTPPPPLEIAPCASGECWWSRGAVDDCRSAGVPTVADRPTTPDSAGVAEIYLGFTQVRLGARGVDAKRSEDAWEEFGFDLDGLCTNPTSCNGMPGMAACKNPPPATPYDGQLCRDNTFGRLQPVLATAREVGDDFGLSEDAFNCELWRGGYNMLVRVSGYNGQQNDPSVRVDYYMSTGLEESVPWKCPTDDDFRSRPRWRSARTWGVDESSLTGPISRPGTLPESKFSDSDAYVKNNYLVARVPDGTPQGFLGNGDPYRGFMFKPRGGLFVGKLLQIKDGTWEIADGLLGGRIAKTDLVNAFREAGFCGTEDVSSFYQSLLEVVDETSDMLASGDIDASKDCDAMSYAIAFQAGQLLPGQATKVPARVPCCPPGKTLEECSAVCGDGKVNGAEKCDTAIAAGQPGACPTSCMPSDKCTPRQLTGSACSAECKPTPITMVGAKDGCCPKGANVTADSDCVAECGNGVVETGETCDPPSSCKNCTPLNSCYTVKPSGNAADCNVQCEQVKTTMCVAGDGCCPEGCNKDNDTDCSNTCGNSMLESPKEACEAGTNRPCPTGCDDRNACTIDASTGSASTCSLICTHQRITAPADNDGCCPEGASANVDSDCKAQCGNRVVEAGEQCDDGNDVAGDSCFECKTEDAGKICLMKQGNNPEDRCAQCTCTKCTREALNCYAAESGSDSRLCRDMVNCAYENKCGNPDCFCGSASLFGCLGGGANGPCKQRIQDAAKSDSLLDIDVRGTDLTYPLGRANAVFTCRQRYCASECMTR
ncbi:MAG TPA: DUF4215 domain-containing protein [Polyangiales bacterium]|nr:DUF4215 domain-containing protein [Polyangiales bacterium]